jgi:sodium transport system permease protein
MKKVLVIFKKELLDTLRDRRTVMMMVVMPVMMVFLMMNLVTKLATKTQEEAMEKVLEVALISNGNAGDFVTKMKARSDMKVREDVKPADIDELLKQEKLDFALIFSADFDNQVGEEKTGAVELKFKSSSNASYAKSRIRRLVQDYEKELLNSRLESKQLSESFVEPIKISELDLATMKERIGEKIGGFLPYFFILFCFLGAMYPAIDLAAGEKERATIETLLTSPASRMQIVGGKFLVVTLTGVVSALISILALYLSLSKSGGPGARPGLEVLFKIVEPQSIAMMITLLIPLCVFFAAVMLALSLFAKSFKEAQSIITPLNFIVFIPIIVGMFPGVKLTLLTAMIPVLNVSLATKAILSGTISTGLLVIVYSSLVALAVLALAFCTWWFNREDVIFRGI